MWTAFNFDPRFDPSRIQDELVAAGRYGRKTTHGFYDYSESADRPDPAVLAPGQDPGSLELHGSCAQLDTFVDRSGLEVVRREPGRSRVVLPDGTAVLVTRGATARAEAVHFGTRVAVLDRCMDPGSVAGIAIAASDESAAAAAAGLLSAAGIVARPSMMSRGSSSREPCP